LEPFDPYTDAYTELTKEEEAAARAKEAEEQAALPYKWTQTIGDLDITVEVPGNLKGKDLNVEIKKKKLVLGIKGQEPIISVCSLPAQIERCLKLMVISRVTSLTKFTSTNPRGRSLLLPKARRFWTSTWTRSTRCNGGNMSLLRRQR